MSWTKKDLLSIADLGLEEIRLILEEARALKQVFRRGILEGQAVGLLFYEPSTRTRLSFHLAAQRLGAHVLDLEISSSSVQKGESLLDTAKTLEAMGTKVLVVRHPENGAPQRLAPQLKVSVVNAGDGTGEHPTQALLDFFTIEEKKASLKGLPIAIVGDVLHSRVTHSLVPGFKRLGADVFLCGPRAFMTQALLKKLDVEGVWDLRSALRRAEVVYLLRIQRERHRGKGFPTPRQYAREF